MKFDIKEEHLIIKPYKSNESIYVREQKGFYQRIRRYLGWLLMLTFIAIPFIQFNGEQAVLLDVAKQEFRLFSVTFWPQDFVLLAGIFMVAAFALFFITTWLGRVWCGYTCPQTIWTLAFIWVEHRIEGKRNQRKALDKAPWSINKLQKRVAKHSIWLVMSLFTATTFMSYFIPASDLYSEMIAFEWSGLITFWVVFFTFCTYGNAGWMREQVCIYLCPYSRFQSAMFDKNTFLVAYDTKRGESRGPRKRKADHKSLGLGDCVDCNLCVEVCPVGIDIRNGMQYECINCGLCVDACDETMSRFNYPTGLISYTSEQRLLSKKPQPFNLKLAAYGSLCIMLVAALGLWINERIPLEASVLRDRNALYRVNYEGMVENTYTLKILNKSQQSANYRIYVEDIELDKIIQGEPIKTVQVAAGKMQEVPLTLSVDSYNLQQKMTNISFIIQSVNQPTTVVKKETVFFSD
ncbi:cytochrome c oxidase accessory protein CcoG [Colwellia sp. D2M02]|uniref:Cytochrome c oxidase accessory protein CcoG n=1 Tax=Colwellia asteriadis TaxID=517723 RepID=A0ABN1L722_9GAMM|nr:cytochrome c oxidase accessory protein CcoG [Colwellia sp. D2M02]MBU2895055.1 cytochrome c oxidase accessory protein CcoG [Colwellia sp. D2M02]